MSHEAPSTPEIVDFDSAHAEFVQLFDGVVAGAGGADTAIVAPYQFGSDNLQATWNDKATRATASIRKSGDTIIDLTVTNGPTIAVARTNFYRRVREVNFSHTDIPANRLGSRKHDFTVAVFSEDGITYASSSQSWVDRRTGGMKDITQGPVTPRNPGQVARSIMDALRTGGTPTFYRDLFPIVELLPIPKLDLKNLPEENSLFLDKYSNSINPSKEKPYKEYLPPSKLYINRDKK